jgi:hypothetical protein
MHAPSYSYPIDKARSEETEPGSAEALHVISSPGVAMPVYPNARRVDAAAGVNSEIGSNEQADRNGFL